MRAMRRYTTALIVAAVLGSILGSIGGVTYAHPPSACPSPEPASTGAFAYTLTGTRTVGTVKQRLTFYTLADSPGAAAEWAAMRAPTATIQTINLSFKVDSVEVKKDEGAGDVE